MKPIHLVVLWVATTGVVFWQVKGKYMLPVTVDRALKPVPTQKDPVAHRLLAGHEGKIVLVNFYNPDCACSRYNAPYVEELAREFEPKGVDIVTVAIGDGSPEPERRKVAEGRHLPGQLVVDADNKIIQHFDILAAPAAVVFDRSGKPVYRGAYNAGRLCRDEETAYVYKTLAALVQGKPESYPSLPFYGCSNYLK